MSTILVVDDDESYRRMIEQWLGQKGCRVITASNGIEALDRARNHPPDLALSDILMPAMDGFSLCRQWHLDARLCAIPFVIFSATYTDLKDEALAMSLGARCFIHKSSDVHTLWNKLQQVLHTDSTADRVPCVAGEVDESEHLKHYNERLIRKLEAKMVEIQQTQQALRQEIEHRKQLEKALRDSEKQFRAFVENSVDGLLVTDAAGGQFVYANPAMCSLLGYTLQQMSRMTLADIVQKKDLTLVSNEFKDLAQGRKSLARAIPCRRRNGDTAYVDIAAKSFEQDGRVFVVGFFRNITDRLEVEAERQRLAEVVEHSPNIVIITDFRRRIVYVNPAFERITGYSGALILGQPANVLVHGQHPPRFIKNIWHTVRKGSQWTGRLTNRKKDGHLYRVEANIIPVLGQEGQIKNFVAVLRDVTQEERLAARLRQAQKMEAIGTLAGGIAHDFNNILTALLGFSELGQMSCDNDAKAREHFAAIYDSGQRAKELVAQILTFSRFSEENHKPIFLHAIVKEALKLLRSTLPTTIEFKTDICQENIYVMADATAIHQIMMNLCTNAAHAMEGRGGTLTVKLEQVTLTSRESSLHCPVKAGPHLKLTVGDTGHGMTRDTLDHIFEPYFTTKKKGQGTGLGLSVVHGIVQSHGGMVNVSSEPGQGTTFEVYFPVAVMKPKAVESGHKSIANGNEHILFVDDELMLVNLVRQMLTKLGYSVTAFTDSREALTEFSASPDSYDVVISDMTMPHMTGDALAKSIFEIRPDIPFILCTGYRNKIDQARITQLGIHTLLTKPFSMAGIAKSIRSSLDALGKERGPDRRPNLAVI